MDTQEVTLVVIGVALMLIAFLVEIEHRIIWKNYKKSYHKHKNQFIDKMLRPNVWVYRLNIYVVWPLVLILGVAVVNLQ